MNTITLKLTERSAFYLSQLIDDHMENLSRKCGEQRYDGDAAAVAEMVREWRSLQPVADELKAKGGAVFFGW